MYRGKLIILQFEKHASLLQKYFDHRDDRVYRRRGVFAGSRIFIRVPVSLGNNLAGVAFVISSALLRACNGTRFVFTHLSLPCSVCGDSSGDL